MDRISGLPEAVLLKILSLLPTTKDVVATMVLSKRWQHLWMMVPKLLYSESYQNMEYGRFSRFVDRSLVMHEAPVIETLHFKLGETTFGNGDIRVWLRAADKFSVRELIVEIDTCSSNKTPVKLPRSLYTRCRTLLTLNLSNAVLVDDATSPISCPSLKKMTLTSIKYPGDEFFSRFLSSCPVLEDLVVKQCPDDNVTVLSIRVPSLKSLALHKSADLVKNDVRGFVIDAPSLECLDNQQNNMPKIVKADVDLYDAHTKQLLGSLTSVKRLYLCLPTSKDANPNVVGSVFQSCTFKDMHL